MKANHIYRLMVTSLTLLIVLACNALVPIPTVAPSPVPTTVASTPVSQPFVISTLHFDETGENSEYTINTSFPGIVESDDPRARAFNDEIHNLVQNEMAAFKRGIAELPADPAFAASFFNLEHGLYFQSRRLASIKFDVAGYTSGAAHPYHYTITVNYNFDKSRSLSLDELFLPGSNSLEVIAGYCITELSTREIGFDMFSEGAAPTPENYRNWNITPEGLIITFDEYQVAPYAAGPQTVIVPYDGLKAVMDPAGPLAGVIR